jgi:hypothetical protein
MLIDEVLAVGDAAFQQKCSDAFREMKALGKTVVLVTHDMATVEEFCHRALLIDSGRIQHAGDPAEVGRRYTRLNFERESTATPSERTSDEVRLLDAWIEDDGGDRLTNLEHGKPIHLRLELEALRDSDGFGLGFMLANADGIGVFQFGVGLGRADGSTRLSAGERMTARADLENPLAPGRYVVHAGVNRTDGSGVALYIHNLVDFVVFGGDGQPRGIVSIPHTGQGRIEES